MGLRLGYNSNGFASHGFEDALPLLADHGYEVVAITPDVGHLDPRYSTPEEVRAVGQRCQDLGLEIVVESGARFALDPRRKHRPNLLELDDSKDIRLKYLRHLIEWCDLLGAGVLSFWSGVLPEGQTPQGATGRLVDACGNLGQLAERYGVQLALEPEPGHFIDTVAAWNQFREGYSPPVSLAFDVGHALATEEGEPHAILAENAGHIISLQLDDMARGEHRHLGPGEGDMDWESLAGAVQALESDVPACWELSRDSHRFHELAPAAADFSREKGLI